MMQMLCDYNTEYTTKTNSAACYDVDKIAQEKHG